MNDAMPAAPDLKKVDVKPEPKAKKKPVAKKAVKKAQRRKPAAPKMKATKKPKRRAFPYAKVAKLWAKGKSLTEISKTTGYFNTKSDDPNHRLRVALTAMHKGWRDAKGKVHRLPHRISPKALKAATKAGRKAARG